MNNYKKNKRKSKSERVGFYVALSICIVAVGLAVWSTYTSVNDYLKSTSEEDYRSSLGSVEDVQKNVTGITEPVTTKVPETIEQVILTLPDETEEAEETKTSQESTVSTDEAQETDQETEDVLRQILQVASSLQYPVNSKTVLNMYSEEAVLNKTMNDFRAHTGADFKGEKGEDVFAMCEGIVESIYNDDMMGKVVSVVSNGYSVLYCGIDNPVVKAEETVEPGDKIGQIGVVPFEELDESHIHIEVRVNGKPIDPLTVIASNE